MQYWTALVSGKEKIDGEKLISSRFPEFDFFYYIDKNNVYWICELRSGFSLGNGHDLNEAKLKVIENLKKTGIEKTKKILSTVLERYGVANIKRRGYGKDTFNRKMYSVGSNDKTIDTK